MAARGKFKIVPRIDLPSLMFPHTISLIAMRIVLCSILSTFGVTASIIPLAQPGQAQSQTACTAAINAIEQRIESLGRVQVVYQDYRDISSQYLDAPAGRPYEYIYGLEGDRALDVLNSPVTAADMAGNIFESCSSVGNVSFGIYQTGIAYTLGWSADGEWITFQCQDDDDYTGLLSWGEKYCT